jgi:hypothetical protein
VIDNSNGAFLWVLLILRALVVGLNNANSLETLYNKTTSLPRDLDHLYNDLLLSMHRGDKNQAYRFLSLALVSPQPCPLIQFSSLREWVDPTDLADLALPPLSSDKLKECLATARRQVAGDCLGLSEIVEDPGQVEVTLQARVRFAYDSIASFLRSNPPAWRAMDGKPYDAFRALCNTFRIHIKAAGLALTRYTSASIWEFPSGAWSFEADIYHLVYQSKLQSGSSKFDHFLSRAGADICAIHPGEATAFKRCFTQFGRYPPKLNPQGMVFLIAGVRGYKVGIPPRLYHSVVISDDRRHLRTSLSIDHHFSSVLLLNKNYINLVLF